MKESRTGTHVYNHQGSWVVMHRLQGLTPSWLKGQKNEKYNNAARCKKQRRFRLSESNENRDSEGFQHRRQTEMPETLWPID